MDFILLSAIYDICRSLILVVSYDIACQFFKNFFTRMQRLPARLQTPIPRTSFITKIPKGHLEAHGDSCHGPYNFNYTFGVGMTHAESPEHGWSILNKAAPSAKEMTPAARRDVLDDFCGYHNWRKMVNLGMESSALLFASCIDRCWQVIFSSARCSKA